LGVEVEIEIEIEVEIDGKIYNIPYRKLQRSITIENLLDYNGQLGMVIPIPLSQDIWEDYLDFLLLNALPQY